MTSILKDELTVFINTGLTPVHRTSAIITILFRATLGLQSYCMKKKGDKETSSPEGLWIAPRYSLKGAAGERAWDNRPGGPPNSGRLLELADIALGLKKPSPKKRKPALASTHDKSKTEPYSR